ncbi:predicted protein [Chaetoceros tenuissimus]|uniref:Uncharacterized protein n=1 Tax=Chaetoceros tenuissimus TaxID=426638 RepID=A0AAD3H7M2_9STRA|nr:predicted protein [Chaetoceros tenuissimus]
MENKFANLVLDQVEAVLTREPSADALYDMLRIASPLLDKASLKQEHPKLFKNLQTKVHPDRHVHSVKRANDLFQALEPFHAKCVKMLDVISPRTISPSTTSAKRGRSPVNDSFDDFYLKEKRIKRSSSFPLNFHVTDHWKHLSEAMLLNHPHDMKLPNRDTLGSSVAYKCINMRGAIAHGRAPSVMYYATGSALSNTVQEHFGKNGGYYKLSSVDMIKQELMTRGPVVSTSFVLMPSFFNSKETRNKSYLKSLLFDKHPVILLGWENTELGEVWNFCPLYQNVGNASILSLMDKVAFGQFGIEDECLVPASSFESWAWQVGPYFKCKIESIYYNMWGFQWPCMNLAVTQEQLSELIDTLGGDIIQAATEKKQFTLQNVLKPAHSRACHLEKVKSCGNYWVISLRFS